MVISRPLPSPALVNTANRDPTRNAAIGAAQWNHVCPLETILQQPGVGPFVRPSAAPPVGRGRRVASRRLIGKRAGLGTGGSASEAPIGSIPSGDRGDRARRGRSLGRPAATRPASPAAGRRSTAGRDPGGSGGAIGPGAGRAARGPCLVAGRPGRSRPREGPGKTQHRQGDRHRLRNPACAGIAPAHATSG
jgi:hypothetical protein